MKSMVRANVKKAFKLIGDLKDPITFRGKEPDSFNFVTGQPIFGADTELTLLGVVTLFKQEDSNSMGVKILINYEDIEDAIDLIPNIYTKVIVRGVEYTLNIATRDSMKATNNGYTLTMQLLNSTA